MSPSNLMGVIIAIGPLEFRSWPLCRTVSSRSKSGWMVMKVTVKTTKIATPILNHDFIAYRLGHIFSWVNGTKVWPGMLLK